MSVKLETQLTWINNDLTAKSIDYIKELPVHEVQKLLEKIAVEVGFFSAFKERVNSTPVGALIPDLEKLGNECLELKDRLASIHNTVIVNAASDLKQLKLMDIDFYALRNQISKDMESMSIALKIIKENLEPHRGKPGRKTKRREHELRTPAHDHERRQSTIGYRDRARA